MAPSRLNDSHKKEIVERYRAGETSASIAALYGCSANTVSRTVRSLLSSEEYNALKIQRSTRSTVKETRLAEININELISTEVTHSENGGIGDDLHQKEPPSTGADSTNEDSINEEKDGQSLVLNDADDLSRDDHDEIEEFTFQEDDVFHEIAVLPVDLPQVTTQQVICRQFATELLPESVYMLVDKTVELDPRPLSEFPELGLSDPSEQQRQALCLYASPRAAKRQCGRSQRVIKVPDTHVFAQTSSYLLARGITHLVIDGSLFTLMS